MWLYLHTTRLKEPEVDRTERLGMRNCLLLALLLVGSAWGDPRQTHEALFELFYPAGMEGRDQLTESAWQAFGSGLDLRGLEGLAGPQLGRRLAAMAGSERADLRFQAAALRQLYVGFIYSSPIGWQLARTQAPSLEGDGMEWPRLPPGNLDNLDFVVVGSGPAGSVIAHELVGYGYKVALVERGSLVRPGFVDTREVARLKEGGGAVPTADGSVLVRNAEVVGGGTTVNIDLAFAPTLDLVRTRLDAWGVEWATAERVANAYTWVEEKVGTRSPDRAEVNANNDILWQGAEAIGLEPRLYDLNTYPPGQSPWVATDKRSSVESLLVPAFEQGLVMLPDAEVERVVVEEGRAVGVEVRGLEPWPNRGVVVDPCQLGLAPGQRREIRARQTILCAGAKGSATVLLRSGLGGPEVGRGVVLHPSIPLIGRFDREIKNLEGTPSTVYVPEGDLLYECMAAGPGYAAVMMPGSGPEIAERIKAFPHLGGFGVLVVDEPHPENRVELVEGRPVVRYSLHQKDKQKLAHGVAQSIRMLFAAGAREVYLPTCEPLLPGQQPGHLLVLTSPEQAETIEQNLRFISASTVLTSAHMQSSCKLGAVVDEHFRVKGVEGLYLCDSSVFPTSVGANPMQTIYTVAKLFVEGFAP